MTQTLPTIDKRSVSSGQRESLTQCLQQKFHLKTFRKGQLSIIESVVSGQDTMAVMPTGGGKSLCYQLPSVYLNGLVIIVSPLIALMRDQVRLLQALGLRAGCLHSGQSLDEKRQVFSQMKEGGSFVLYLSPERVQSSGFAQWVQHQNIALFAIDEAHCVSQWGPDFREDYHRLSLLRQLKPDVPILALTATATPQVLDDISRQLRLKKPAKHVYGFYRPNLFYQVEICPDEFYKFSFLLNAVKATPEGKILIYCGTRKQCEEISASLSQDFNDVAYYHAGLDSETRKDIQMQMDEGLVRILAATNAFGMGIDYPDVRLVVHYQMPANIESFYQEMGRAGRDGLKSKCLLLYSKRDRGLHSYFIQQSSAAPSVIGRRWDCLDAITQFVEGGECRHSGILTYFRDSERISECGHCDICAPSDPQMVPIPENPIPDQSKSKVKLRKKSRKDEIIKIESPEAEARKILLKDWRRAYAKEHDMPAFMIFSDRSLVDLANKNPTSPEELERVYGFGPAKVEMFGHAILQELGHR